MPRPALAVHVRTPAEADAAAAEKRARLEAIAGELRTLHQQQENISLTVGRRLVEVLDQSLIKARPDYDFERWAKLPNGELAAVADWYRREVGKMSAANIGKLIAAARVAEVISQALRNGVAPSNAWQLDPLVRVHKVDGRKVVPAWERAVTLAGQEPKSPKDWLSKPGEPTGAQVRRAAKEVCPEAFEPKRKRHLTAVPGTTVRKRRDKAGARKALAELLDQFDRAVLDAVWQELK